MVLYCRVLELYNVQYYCPYYVRYRIIFIFFVSPFLLMPLPPSRNDGYVLLSNDAAQTQTPQRPPMRPTTIVVIVLAILSFFYVTTSLMTTGKRSSYTATGAKTSFGQYEKLKLQNENAALKEKLAQMTAMIAQQQADTMSRMSAVTTTDAEAPTSSTPSKTPEALKKMLLSASARGETSPSNASKPENLDKLTPELIRSRCNKVRQA